MKKVLLLPFVLLSMNVVMATVIKIKVVDFQFKAKTVNALVGDTIQWIWKGGIHTTTSVTIPAGAAAWNAPMDSAHRKFNYKLRVAGVYKYQCTFHFTVMKGTINVTTALAAGLNSFAVQDDDAKALLNWKTVSSKDVAYFSVQRSTDGDNFREINRVMPSSSNTYHFSDNGATGKYVYYQVKVVDTKGNTQLSDIQMLTRNVKNSPLVLSLSPNPISSPGHLMLQFNADKDGSMLVKLYAQNGRFIKEAEMMASKGLNNGHFHMGDLTPGAYYITCTLGTVTEKHTVIVK